MRKRSSSVNPNLGSASAGPQAPLPTLASAGPFVTAGAWGALVRLPPLVIYSHWLANIVYSGAGARDGLAAELSHAVRVVSCTHIAVGARR
jgi:hypothetical protein